MQPYILLTGDIGTAAVDYDYGTPVVHTFGENPKLSKGGIFDWPEI